MNIYNEIYIQHEDDSELFNSLTQEERVFVYIMMRASLPFSRIYRDQNHRYNNEIIELFEHLYQNKRLIEWIDNMYNKKNNTNISLFNDIETYLVYLWANHGIYFLRDHSNHKRTPEKLNMISLNEDVLITLLEIINYQKPYKHLLKTIFNTNHEQEMVVPNSIESSCNNYYQKGFTEMMYQQIPDDIRNKVNIYFTTSYPYCINYSEKYSNELKVSIYWLQQTLQHIKQYPKTFDDHIVRSLIHLIDFLNTGDEEHFKNHSIEWLKTKSRLDFTLGFIEQYHDPKLIRGHACGEITIKTTNMEKLNPVLLDMETRLPLPEKYKRIMDEKTVLNVSINRQLFGGGDYGPMQITAAYCLPNDDNIRNQHGSKQIIYKMMDQIKLNPKVWDQLVKNDKLYDDLWDLHTLLHETLGHASGKLHKHLTTTGKLIPVTNENITELIGKDYSALEELRAEIIALYVSIAEIDILNQYGLYKDWYNKLGKEELKKYSIMEMCRHMFRRLLSQDENFTEIKGSHERANCVITNFLLEEGGIKISEEVKNIDNQDFHILDIEIVDFNKAFNSVIKLLQLVQEIKSTGNGRKCDDLFSKYTTYPITIEQSRQYRKYVKDIQDKLNGGIKLIAKLYLNYQPVILDGKIVDVQIGEKQDFCEQQMHYSKLMMSTLLEA